MSFTFEENDDGLVVFNEHARLVARITTKIHGETKDPNLRVQKKFVEAIDHKDWQIHFTGTRFTLGSLADFIQAVAAEAQKK